MSDTRTLPVPQPAPEPLDYLTVLSDRLALVRAALFELPPAARARVLLLDEADRAALLAELERDDIDHVETASPDLADAVRRVVMVRRVAGLG